MQLYLNIYYLYIQCNGNVYTLYRRCNYNVVQWNVIGNGYGAFVCTLVKYKCFREKDIYFLLVGLLKYDNSTDEEGEILGSVCGRE